MLSPELSTPLHRVSQYGLRALDIREYLHSSIQASHHAVLQANQAWIQLETLGMDMVSGAFDILGTHSEDCQRCQGYHARPRHHVCDGAIAERA